MYCRGILLSLLVAVVTSQDCANIEATIAANPTCALAFANVLTAIANNGSISSADLNVYCLSTCRNLVNQAALCSGDSDAETFPAFNRFICSTDRGESCYNFFVSEFDALQDAFEASGVCPDDIPDGQMCSSACQTAFQNFIAQNGCCIAELFELVTQDVNEEINDLLAQCPVDLSRGGTCVEIGGGATGLKALGSVLFFAVIIALARF